MAINILIILLFLKINIIHSHPLITKDRAEDCLYGSYSLREIQRDVNEIHQNVLYSSDETVCIYEWENRNTSCNLDVTGRPAQYICRNPRHDIYRDSHSHSNNFLPSSSSLSESSSDESTQSESSFEIINSLESNSEINIQSLETEDSFEVLNDTEVSFEVLNDTSHSSEEENINVTSNLQFFKNFSSHTTIPTQIHKHKKSNTLLHILESLSSNENNSEENCFQDKKSGYFLCSNESECQIGILDYQYVKDLNLFTENVKFLINGNICGFNNENKTILCPPEENFEGKYVCMKKKGKMETEDWKVISNIGDIEGIDMIFKKNKFPGINLKSLIFALDCHDNIKNVCIPKISFFKIWEN